MNADAYNLSRAAVQSPAESRPISNAMSELASSIGDLESAARALAGRISLLLPAGSPFERHEQATVSSGTTLSAPRPVHSHFNDELQSRVYSIASITAAINEMVKSIEI